jgi:hypothetical protein
MIHIVLVCDYIEKGTLDSIEKHKKKGIDDWNSISLTVEEERIKVWQISNIVFQNGKHNKFYSWTVLWGLKLVCSHLSFFTTRLHKKKTTGSRTDILATCDDENLLKIQFVCTSR